MAVSYQFSRNIRKRGRQFINSSTRITKLAAKAALRAWIYNTPVDKGVARSNWRVGVGAQATAVIPAYFPGRKLGIGERANASAALQAGYSRINSVRGVPGVGLKTAIYINNNVPYIEKIDAKSSNPGFLQIGVIAAQVRLDNERLFVDRPENEDP